MGKSEAERLGEIVDQAERLIGEELEVGSYFVLAVGQAINGSTPDASFGTNLTRHALVRTLRSFSTMIEHGQDNPPHG